jgi:hypothetical protein
VLATALLISAGPTAWINRVVLGTVGLVYIGLISFPLYLWHWLLLSFIRLAQGGEASPAQCAMTVLISFLLSWLTYKLVERPLRFGRALHIKTAGLLLALSLLGGIGYYFSIQPTAYSSYQRQADRYLSSIVRSTRESECFNLPYAYLRADTWHCTFGEGASKPTIFVYGDSHAFSILPAFEEYANQLGKRVALLATAGCPPLLGIQSGSEGSWMDQHNCLETNERIFRYVYANQIKTVVLVGRWNYYVGGLTRPEQFNFITSQVEKKPSIESSRLAFAAGLKQTIARYNEIGTHVYWVADNPQQKFAARDVLKKVN